MEFQLDLENEVNTEEDKHIWMEAFVLNANSAVKVCQSAFHYCNVKTDPGYCRDRIISENGGHGIFITQFWKCLHGEWQMAMVEITVGQTVTS